MRLDIKNCRERLNLTQAEFAEKLGVSQSAVSNYEITWRKAPIDVLVRLQKLMSEELGKPVSLESLMEDGK